MVNGKQQGGRDMEVWKPLSPLKTIESMNTQTKHYQKRRSRGFTLLEIVIALGLMGMLVGMIFRVARTSVQLSQMVVENANGHDGKKRVL